MLFPLVMHQKMLNFRFQFFFKRFISKTITKDEKDGKISNNSLLLIPTRNRIHTNFQMVIPP